jgi:hypothetical protein
VLLLAGDPQNANVQVESNVPGAQLFVNGKKWTTFKSGKSWTVLFPGTNVLWAEKEGYQRSTEQRLEVKKGDVITTLRVFELRPVVLTASLIIEGATPQAMVLIDNNPLAPTSDDGSFKRDDIVPGNHTLMLRKADFEDKQFGSRTFTAGQEVRISGAEGQLTQLGSLEFHVTPPNASITYKRLDEQQAHQIDNGKGVRIRAGRYTVTVSADNYLPRTETVAVESGKPTPIPWSLAPQPKISTPPPAPPPPELFFEDQSAWTQEEGWWIHKGSDITRLAVRQGVFRLEYLRQKTKGGFLFKPKTHKVEWLIDERDANNYIDYSFDFKSIDLRAVVDGKTVTKQSRKVPPAAATSDSFPIQIDISQERIVVKDNQGNELTYTRPDPSTPLGKFGFKGDVALKVFRK